MSEWSHGEENNFYRQLPKVVCALTLGDQVREISHVFVLRIRIIDRRWSLG